MRRFIYWLISIFYPIIEIKGEEHLPESGGMIIVSNHPNGIIDPVPLMIKLGRPISFLAKSTLWGIPLLNLFLKTFDALPIFRHQDDGKRYGPKGDATEQNEETFRKAGRLLQNGRILALFPEGTTHSEPQLLPLKTGAARIALQNEATMNWSGNVPIVPIGLWYENKIRFRSSLLLIVGHPFTLESYQSSYQTDHRQAVRDLTAQIDQSLDEVVLQAESQEILRALPVVAKWLNQGNPNLVSKHSQMVYLLSMYEKIKQAAPERLEEIIVEMRRYDGLLRAMGMKDPWQPELPPMSWFGVASRLLFLILLTPFALLGLLISYVPYRLTGFVAERAIQNDYTQLSLAKIVGGMLFYLITWFGLMIWIVGRFGGLWGGLFFVATPVLILTTLWWFERVRGIGRRFAQMSLFDRRGGMKRYVAEQREAVIQLITNALEAYR